MRDSGLLVAGSLQRTEESDKTSSIAVKFLEVFADNFSSQQPPEEWQLSAANSALDSLLDFARASRGNQSFYPWDLDLLSSIFLVNVHGT